jgi:P2-related tail formation protein
MKNLLPPNSTKQEKALVDTVDFKVDPNYTRGFKFSPKDEILPWLIEEYRLGEILHRVKDKRKAIKEGVEFQRLRCTPGSLKNCVKMEKYR